MRLALVLAALLLTAAAPAPNDPGLVPVDPADLLVIDTTKGRVLVVLLGDLAPGHVARIKLLAGKGYYDDNLFYRVLGNYIAQTGSKRIGGDYASGEGTLKAEFSATPPAGKVFPISDRGGFLGVAPVGVGSDGRVWSKFCPGAVALAHYDDPDSADSQMFFATSSAASGLEKAYTVWGQVVSGLPALQALAPGQPPSEPDRMIRMRLATSLPEAERPAVRVGLPGSEAFAAALKAARKAKGADLSPCDIVLPVEVTGPGA